MRRTDVPVNKVPHLLTHSQPSVSFSPPTGPYAMRRTSLLEGWQDVAEANGVGRHLGAVPRLGCVRRVKRGFDRRCGLEASTPTQAISYAPLAEPTPAAPPSRLKWRPRLRRAPPRRAPLRRALPPQPPASPTPLNTSARGWRTCGKSTTSTTEKPSRPFTRRTIGLSGRKSPVRFGKL